MKIFIPVFITLIYSCNGPINPNKIRYKVIRFDKENKNIINNLIDSLRTKVGERTSYVMERRKSIYDMQFRMIDSLGKVSGYFEPHFKINDEQKAFYFQADAGDLYFENRDSTYQTKLFKFKQGNQAVWLLVCDKEDGKGEINQPIVYASENRIYYIDDAWP